ncbi:MAG TPA: ATP-dependent RNA helicase HrpA [Burkholderiales bacterium]|nr:ATP-dependent RNA helicase HrpA [Burkholderiales bacterium]
MNPQREPQSTASEAPDLRALQRLVAHTMLRDRHRLRSALARAFDAERAQRLSATETLALAADIERSAALARERRARLPRVRYPEELPVSERKGEIATALAAHQVVIVSGETGSGKTTQLPKVCLELERGVAGMIAHTQPRRIAARTVAARIAQELGSPLGQDVGYRVRFSDRVSERNFLRVMTDGILLAETQTDRMLAAYDTVIIDEAHERSLNIDFLLGYVKRLLPRRPELKLIVTSATIDAQRFSAHFDGAPVIEVSGRLYPVDVRYRPLAAQGEDEQEIDLPEAIADAVDQVARLSAGGDVLVFLPGEREIRETAEVLRKHVFRGAARAQHVEILPLYARLSAQEQERVFQPAGMRRIVLATNVAETSLTVPGIKYVVDSGLARVNRYSYRNKHEMLQVEKISRASADQRAGRCGRVMSGVCVRLYAEEDYQARPAFTDPEILRSSLASVILRMKALKLGEVEDFPFVEPPSARAIADGYSLLVELGAVDAERRLTPVGARLAELPIDPGLARMIVAARDENCLTEMLVVSAGLAIQDVRERPLDKAEAADTAHAPFADERSEFLGLLKLWAFFEDALRHKKSNRRLAQLCRDSFLSYVRLREWRDLHGQLHAQVSELGWRFNQAPATHEQLHRAILTGLLGNVGAKSEEAGVYLGARGIKFAIFPGSPLRKKGPPWLMAAELIETTRLYARTVAAIDTQWLERVGAHLTKTTWHDPHWEKSGGQAYAYERVTLYGLVVVSRRRVAFGPVDPKAAREIFIREALVHGQLATHGGFLRHNRALREEIEALEHKSRRHDVLVDDEAVFAIFDAILPQDVWSAQQFERWRREAERASPRLLFLTREQLMRHAAQEITEQRFPAAIEIGGVAYDLSYRFEPGHPLDGVTLSVPLHLLNQLDERRCEWLVPGLLRDKVSHLLRGLPKNLRRNFVPAPQYVTAALEALEPGEGPLLPALSEAIRRKTGVQVPLDVWDVADLPPHLLMNFKVLDDEGRELAMGRDLPALRAQLGVKARRQFSERARAQFERRGLTGWDFGELPEQVEFTRGGQTLIGYPALVDEGSSIALVVLDTEHDAQAATRKGLRRLFQLAAPEQVKQLARNLPGFQEMSLRYALLLEIEGGKPEKGAVSDRLRQELTDAICDRAFFVEDEPIRDAAAFQARAVKARTRLMDVAGEVCRVMNEILGEYQALRPRINQPGVPVWQRAMTDIRNQLRALLGPGFVVDTPLPRLKQIPRYLRAIQLRLDKFSLNPAKDAQWMQQIQGWWQAWEARVQADRKRGVHDPRLEEFRWMLEELRVSLWAQQLKTPYPVSFKRLEKYWAELG